MNNILKGCISVALTLGVQSVCFADQAVTQSTTTTEGPPVVLDSYMKPTVVQTKETTDAAGNVQKSVAPIIQERHEHVMLPSETTTTTTERSAGPSVVKTEASAVSTKSTTYSAPKRVAVAHRVRHHYKACAPARPRPVAMASQRVSVQRKVVEPAVTQSTEQTTSSQATVIERKDPALNNE